MRKIFTVKIHDQDRDVYSIEGKEHFGYGDVPKTWWIYMGNPLLEGEFPDPKSKNLYPYNKSILRQCWDIHFKQKNTTKFKWDELRFSNHTSVEMWCNGKLVYEFGTSGERLDFAFAKAQYLQVVLREHPYNFFDPESERGRKICFHGLPATIIPGYSAGNIIIKPDYGAGLNKKEWWKELRRRGSRFTNNDDFDDQLDDIENERFEEQMEDDEINWGDALSDENIYWFRK